MNNNPYVPTLGIQQYRSPNQWGGLSLHTNMARTWIRVATAAKLKGVRRQSIYYHIKMGNLVSFDLDGNTYVDRDEVLNLKPRGKGEYQKRKKARTESACEALPSQSSIDPPISEGPIHQLSTH
ncbi:MAG: hypothetical protein ACK4S4_15940 [Pyrinomonadaceae bacterium]